MAGSRVLSISAINNWPAIPKTIDNMTNITPTQTEGKQW
jgi:hypothetical protein